MVCCKSFGREDAISKVGHNLSPCSKRSARNHPSHYHQELVRYKRGEEFDAQTEPESSSFTSDKM